MKKLIAVLLVLLVASAFVFACEHMPNGDCSVCSAKSCAATTATLGATGAFYGSGGNLVITAAGAAAGAVAGFVDGLNGECLGD